MPGKGTGKVVHESDLEAAMTDKLAAQIEESLSITVSGRAKQIESVQVHENVGWHKKAIILRFSDGTGMRFVGQELKVEYLDRNDLPAHGEWPEDAELTVEEAEKYTRNPQPMLPQAEDRVHEDDGA